MDNKLPNFPVESQNYIAPATKQVFSTTNSTKKPLNTKLILAVIFILMLFILPVITYFLGVHQGEAVKAANLAKDMTSLGTPILAAASPTPTPTPILIPTPTLVASGSGMLTASDSGTLTASNSAH